VALSALGYFIGWREVAAYYSTLGATWAAASVPPLALLQLSANLIVVAAAASFFSFLAVLESTAHPGALHRAGATTFALACGLLAVSQGLLWDVSPFMAYQLALAGSFVCAVTAGITLSELLWHTRQPGRKVSPWHLWMVYWVVLPGLFWAPDRLGQARALRDASVSHSSLPVVPHGPGIGRTGEWHLVHMFEGTALLMLPADSPQKRLFKLVEAQDVQVASSTADR